MWWARRRFGGGWLTGASYPFVLGVGTVVAADGLWGGSSRPQEFVKKPSFGAEEEDDEDDVTGLMPPDEDEGS